MTPEQYEKGNVSLMAEREIVIVDADDWAGLYIDGKLVYEGHSIDYRQVFKHLNIDYSRKEADFEWMDEVGRLPENLSEVELADG